MNLDSVEAYPLHWPPGRKRCKSRQRAKFHRVVEKRYANSEGTYSEKQGLTIGDSRDRLYRELQNLGARKVIISSNLELKNDGTPRASQREPDDPGIAVYFQFNNTPHCLSCDSWTRAADNLAAIAKHVEAMRGQLRWGVADIASMFAGFKALPGAIVTPAPMSIDEAYRFIKLHSGAVNVIADFENAYRAAAKKLHPDANSGNQLPEWSILQEAKRVICSN